MESSRQWRAVDLQEALKQAAQQLPVLSSELPLQLTARVIVVNHTGKYAPGAGIAFGHCRHARPFTSMLSAPVSSPPQANGAFASTLAHCKRTQAGALFP